MKADPIAPTWGYIGKHEILFVACTEDLVVPVAAKNDTTFLEVVDPRVVAQISCRGFCNLPSRREK